MGMISWIIEQDPPQQDPPAYYDVGYLENTNKAAADADGEPTWTDSTYLVGTFTDSEGKGFPALYHRLGRPALPTAAQCWTTTTWSGRVARSWDTTRSSTGSLELTLVLENGVEVKTAFHPVGGFCVFHEPR